MGYGPHVYRNILIANRQDAFRSKYNWKPARQCNAVRHFQHVSFGGWGKAVEFKDIKVGKGILPRTSKDAPVFTVGYDVDQSFQQFNQPNVLTMSSRTFSVVLEVQGLSDVSIGFLKNHHYTLSDQDPDAYEIVLHQVIDHLHSGDEVRPRTLIRRAIGNGRGPILKAVSSSVTDPIISPTEFRPFWIQLQDGELSVGRGVVAGKHVLISAEVPTFPQRSLVMGFGGDFTSSAFRVLAAHSVSAEDNINVNFQAKELADGYKNDENDFTPLTFTIGAVEQWVHPVPRTLQSTCDPFYDTCKRPPQSHVTEIPGISPRVQWRSQGGYCMETCIQIAGLSRGMYVNRGGQSGFKITCDVLEQGTQRHRYSVSTACVLVISSLVSLS
jgi:hypothetical protein